MVSFWFFNVPSANMLILSLKFDLFVPISDSENLSPLRALLPFLGVSWCNRPICLYLSRPSHPLLLIVSQVFQFLNPSHYPCYHSIKTVEREKRQLGKSCLLLTPRITWCEALWHESSHARRRGSGARWRRSQQGPWLQLFEGTIHHLAVLYDLSRNHPPSPATERNGEVILRLAGWGDRLAITDHCRYRSSYVIPDWQGGLVTVRLHYTYNLAPEQPTLLSLKSSRKPLFPNFRHFLHDLLHTLSFQWFTV